MAGVSVPEEQVQPSGYWALQCPPARLGHSFGERKGMCKAIGDLAKSLVTLKMATASKVPKAKITGASTLGACLASVCQPPWACTPSLASTTVSSCPEEASLGRRAMHPWDKPPSPFGDKRQELGDPGSTPYPLSCGQGDKLHRWHGGYRGMQNCTHSTGSATTTCASGFTRDFTKIFSWFASSLHFVLKNVSLQ